MSLFSILFYLFSAMAYGQTPPQQTFLFDYEGGTTSTCPTQFVSTCPTTIDGASGAANRCDTCDITGLGSSARGVFIDSNGLGFPEAVRHDVSVVPIADGIVRMRIFGYAFSGSSAKFQLSGFDSSSNLVGTITSGFAPASGYFTTEVDFDVYDIDVAAMELFVGADAGDMFIDSIELRYESGLAYPPRECTCDGATCMNDCELLSCTAKLDGPLCVKDKKCKCSGETGFTDPPTVLGCGI